MEDAYDVVIVGAGPAGAQCARYIREHSDYAVLLLDQTQEIGEPKKSTAGTFIDVVQEFAIPQEAISQEVTNVILEGPSQQAQFPTKGVVMDFARFKKFLAKDALEKGTHIEINTHVTHPLIENGTVCGVQYRGLEGEGQVRARIVVDASGPAAVLAQQIKLRVPDASTHWTGMEFEMEHVDFPRGGMLFKLDRTIAPGGYAWIFSTGERTAKVGLCWSDKYCKAAGGSGSLVSYLHRWIKQDPRLKDAIALEVHGGDAYMSTKQSKKVADNFVCIGDSVCTINPFAAEGIRPALKSANMAGQAIIAALDANDTSQKTLAAYEKEWNKYAYLWEISDFAASKIYQMNNEQLDNHVTRVSKLNKDIILHLQDMKFSLKDGLSLFRTVF